MNRCSYILIVRRRHGDVCASSHHLSISNQTFRSTGKTPTETFLNDVGLELGRAELRFWLIDLFDFFFWEARNTEVVEKSIPFSRWCASLRTTIFIMSVAKKIPRLTLISSISNSFSATWIRLHLLIHSLSRTCWLSIV
ncbi:unnamed protein product, partial [Brassica napus]